MDYDVDHYSIDELLQILELNADENLTEQKVRQATNSYVQKSRQVGNEEIATFFTEIQTKLLEYLQESNNMEDMEEQIPHPTQTEKWWKYEALPQDDLVQKNKITDRVQKIDVFQNSHLPMNREQLGVSNNYQVPVSQDTLNPNLENITSRFINLDSQFRSNGTESATNYTLDLSDPLTNVLNMRLYAISIPFTWYVIDTAYGNTCFWITNAGNTFQLSIEPGNYTAAKFVAALNSEFENVGFTPTPCTAVSYNTNNGKITIALSGYTDPSGNVLATMPSDDIFNNSIYAYFTFFDFTGSLSCSGHGGCTVKNLSFHGSLGWLMGFRDAIEPVLEDGNTAAAIIDLYGTRYFILVVDDFNQNHINNGLVSITELSQKLALPSYYNTSQPTRCVSMAAPSINLIGNADNEVDEEFGLDGAGNVGEKDFGVGMREIVLPSAPRTLTQAQIYTINQIIKNRAQNTTFKATAPTATDTFALIPIKHGGMDIGDMYVEFGSSLQNNKRIYFGPVNIERMRIKLLNDHGNVVDLHGVDWTFTLISENLYQY